ncbi:MAG: hypothetical protein B6244_10515 [Candidatus Cloacimonetes bacterium 4572_55]|nr:MAG: hypothetical protein B6244_10515 [Candidatus Cloacimonetes bacterium 4572_55]
MITNIITIVEQYSVILFDSTSYALQAEKKLLQARIVFKLIPTPRKISSDCGICARVRRADVQCVQKVLENAQVQTAGCYEI